MPLLLQLVYSKWADSLVYWTDLVVILHEWFLWYDVRWYIQGVEVWASAPMVLLSFTLHHYLFLLEVIINWQVFSSFKIYVLCIRKYLNVIVFTLACNRWSNICCLNSSALHGYFHRWTQSHNSMCQVLKIYVLLFYIPLLSVYVAKHCWWTTVYLRQVLP